MYSIGVQNDGDDVARLAPVRLYKICPEDIVMATSLLEACQWYCKETGVEPQDIYEARELTNDEMDRPNYFNDIEGSLTGEEGKLMSLREALGVALRQGQKPPRIMCSTEY
jgi:hypothetical protein